MKINPKMLKRIPNNIRHIRWNWEMSPDNFEMARYHFVIVDDKNRRQILEKIIEPLTQYGSIIKIRNNEGSVANSKCRYLLYSFDINQKPELLNFAELGKPVKKDPNLKERIKKGTSIEDYVADLYMKKAA